MSGQILDKWSSTAPSPRAALPHLLSPPTLQHLLYFFTSKRALLLDCRPSENLAEIVQVPGLTVDKGETSASQTAHGLHPPEEAWGAQGQSIWNVTPYVRGTCR